MKLHYCEQRSPEWHALRIGRFTGTQFTTVANGIKKGIETLCNDIASERRSGLPAKTPFINESMQHGIDTEEEAIAAYEYETLSHVGRVGFVELDDYFGCSPDGLLDPDGLLEIKCPQCPTHLKYLRAKGKAWTEYKWQIQSGLYMSGRKWLHFVSYCPMDPRRLLIEKVLPDMTCFAKIKSGMEVCRKRVIEMMKEV